VLLAAVALGASSSPALAETNFLGGLHFNAGLPQGELDDQLGRDAYGLGGQIFYAPSVSPLAVGLDVSWMNYGRRTRREPLSTTIPEVTVDVETMNNVVQAFAVLRAQTPRGPIQLYGDALVGLNYLYTETTIKDTDDVLDEIASTTNQEDSAFAYGFGGGVMVAVYTRSGEPAGGSSLQVLIDGGARYLIGDRAKYLREGSIRVSDGRVSFETLESETDLLRSHLGVAVRW
jgi:hypothetical protein